MVAVAADATRGLPPQVRGEPRQEAAERAGVGLTPAGAGRTATLFPDLTVREAYPRRCGENYERRRIPGPGFGLPPQVRGEPTFSAYRRRPSGLTPAGAGRTCCPTGRWSASTAYPRRCGENGGDGGVGVVPEGLPPQVRGERPARLRRRRVGGLTPAGAGRTRFRGVRASGLRAYPRRCGENGEYVVGGGAQSGLPPQVRGELPAPPQACGVGGLTPAGAGRTVRGAVASRRRPAYPRRCGENEMHISGKFTSLGLPPQVRGEHGHRRAIHRQHGLTPAGAGRTGGRRR